jgi:hypothetical protein
MVNTETTDSTKPTMSIQAKSDTVCLLPLPASWSAYLGLCMALLLFGYLGGRQGIHVQF